MADTKPLIYFLRLCKTLGQAKALLSFVDLVTDKNDAVLSITASRGRGKTFVCGLYIAYALVSLKFKLN